MYSSCTAPVQHIECTHVSCATTKRANTECNATTVHLRCQYVRRRHVEGKRRSKTSHRHHITHHIRNLATMTTQTRDAATNQLEVQATAKQGTLSTLTTGNGAPVDSLTASMTAGERCVMFEVGSSLDSVCRHPSQPLIFHAI